MKIETFKKASAILKEKQSLENQKEEYQMMLSALLNPHSDLFYVRITCHLSPNDIRAEIPKSSMIALINQEINRTDYMITEKNMEFMALEDVVT